MEDSSEEIDLPENTNHKLDGVEEIQSDNDIYIFSFGNKFFFFFYFFFLFFFIFFFFLI